MPSSVQTVTKEAITVSQTGKNMLLETNPNCRATCTSPRMELLRDPKEPVAFDVEFQQHKPEGANGWGHRMGRVAVVNTRGQTIYDVYVRYEYDPTVGTMMAPPIFGVTRKDLWMRNGARENMEVERNLRKIFQDRTIVGHGMGHDLVAVGDVWEEDHVTVDTQHLYGQRKLCDLVAQHLDGDTKFTFHNPVDDARATMLLYLKRYRYDGRSNFDDTPPTFDEEAFPALGAAGSNKKK